MGAQGGLVVVRQERGVQVEPVKQAAGDRRGQDSHDAEARPLVTDVAHDPEDQTQHRAAGRQPGEERFLARLHDDPRAARHAQQDAGVNQAGAFQQQEQDKRQQSAFDLVAGADLAEAGQHQGRNQTAADAQADRFDIGPVRRLQGHEQKQADVNALKDVFQLHPAHDVSSSSFSDASWKSCRSNSSTKHR